MEFQHFRDKCIKTLIMKNLILLAVLLHFWESAITTGPPVGFICKIPEQMEWEEKSNS